MIKDQIPSSEFMLPEEKQVKWYGYQTPASNYMLNFKFIKLTPSMQGIKGLNMSQATQT